MQPYVPRKVRLIDEIEHFLDVYEWVRETVLREDLLKRRHVALLRRAASRSGVNLLDFKKATGLPKYTATRTLADLVKWKLAEVAHAEGSGKLLRVNLTPRGLAALRRIDRAVLKRFLQTLSIDNDSDSQQLLARNLDVLNRFLPSQDIGTPRFFVPEDCDQRATMTSGKEKTKNGTASLSRSPTLATV
jgi:DNA-binding MarR family transcriptional regulator